jgi:micrococcal nuclease
MCNNGYLCDCDGECVSGICRNGICVSGEVCPSSVCGGYKGDWVNYPNVRFYNPGCNDNCYWFDNYNCGYFDYEWCQYGCSNGTCVTPPSDEPPIGNLSVDLLDVSINEPIKLTITATDDNEVSFLYLWYQNDFHSYECFGNQTSCSYTWTISESNPGEYFYCGYIFDNAGNGSWTTPDCVVVKVNPPKEPEITVIEVRDGDTIVLSNGEEIRLIGINTPERGQPFYEEATTRLKELIENKKVILEKDQEEEDIHGRLLRYVFFNNENINVKMVEEGLAKVWIIPPNTKYENELRNAWERCLEREVNLCKPTEDKCDSRCIGIQYFHWDAAGDDRYNLNDEYVTFINNCSYSCDLTSWRIEDEARHWYNFPTFLLGSGEIVTLHTGFGTNTKRDLYWNSYKPIWNNTYPCDTLYLWNNEGELILDYSYRDYCK